MAKNNSNNNRKKGNSGPNGKSGQKGSNEKSFFRVDDNRAMKAKKNKAFVKFNKVC